MRKIVFSLITLIVAVLLGSWFLWEAKTSVAAYVIARHLQVPVTLKTLEISQTQIDLERLWIGNPLRSQTNTAFASQTIDIDMDVPNIFDNPLIIDQIEIANIFVGIEYYENGSTNWDTILHTAAPSSKKGKDYLIRTLVLENLTVEVTQANGQKKRYPTIARMEFHNISNETGFPVAEIEKAIFNLMMKHIMDKFNLFKQPLNLPVKSPLRYLPNF